VESVVLSNKLWVPRGLVEPQFFKPFCYRIFDAYTQTDFEVETFDEEIDRYGFARGDIGKVHEVFGSAFQIEDQRASVPIGYPLRFTGTLRDDQERAVTEWIDAGYGVLESPPRSGKTVMMVALMCRLRQRTMMLAHLEDLCHQLEDTVRKFTNINELEDRYGQKLCGVLQEWTDFYPILTLSTYQCFAVSNRGREVIRSRRDDFGLVMVDEVHKCLVAGTLVDGRPIETIQAGDLVSSYDHEAHEVQKRRVSKVFRSPASALVKINLDGGFRPIVCTPDHTFWNSLNYIKAEQLPPGSCLFAAAFGNLYDIPVRKVEPLDPGPEGLFGGQCPDGFVYNLEVEGNHNYFANGSLTHNCKTQLYTEVIGELNAAYRCGVTATPKRKDKLHCIVNDVIGPVTGRGYVEQLAVDWTWEYTDVYVDEFRSWATLWNRLCRSNKRNNKIASKVVEDVDAGHFVLVTTERLQHIDVLKEKIQKLNPDITVAELSGRTWDREKFRKDCLAGKYQVVIAISRIAELGYNIPRWSCLHNTLPMTNRPNWYQRISRIRTPFEPAFPGDHWVKPKPVCRVWSDYGHRAVWAYRSVVKAENDARGFCCLNPEEKKRKPGRRQGLLGLESAEEDHGTI
jgi:superfamily II DNA or RNA helicase